MRLAKPTVHPIQNNLFAYLHMHGTLHVQLEQKHLAHCNSNSMAQNLVPDLIMGQSLLSLNMKTVAVRHKPGSDAVSSTLLTNLCSDSQLRDVQLFN